MRPKILANKPLVEAILELKWKPSLSAQSNGVDADLRLFLGKFHDALGKEYPALEILPTATVAEQMTPNLPAYRFRKSEGGWPVVQLGSGILTVNDTASYTWDDFRGRILRTVDLLIQTYAGKLDMLSLELRYLNAVAVDFDKEDIAGFLLEKFGVVISMPDTIFEGNSVTGRASLFSLQMGFPTNAPKGTLRISFARGKSNDKDALVWETVIQSGENQIPQFPDGFIEWLESAHGLAEECFFKLINGELLKRFS
jgi:uncharacterized protein (TIGR04255 family)